MAGEYTVAELKRGLAKFLARYRPSALAQAVPIGLPTRPAAAAQAAAAAVATAKAAPMASHLPVSSPAAAAAAGAAMRVGAPELAPVVPPRPPGFCVGCPSGRSSRR